MRSTDLPALVMPRKLPKMAAGGGVDPISGLQAIADKFTPDPSAQNAARDKLDALTERLNSIASQPMQGYNPTLAFAQGALGPTRTGSFGESLGNALGNMQNTQQQGAQFQRQGQMQGIGAQIKNAEIDRQMAADQLKTGLGLQGDVARARIAQMNNERQMAYQQQELAARWAGINNSEARIGMTYVQGPFGPNGEVTTLHVPAAQANQMVRTTPGSKVLTPQMVGPMTYSGGDITGGGLFGDKQPPPPSPVPTPPGMPNLRPGQGGVNPTSAPMGAPMDELGGLPQLPTMLSNAASFTPTPPLQQGAAQTPVIPPVPPLPVDERGVPDTNTIPGGVNPPAAANVPTVTKDGKVVSGPDFTQDMNPKLIDDMQKEGNESLKLIDNAQMDLNAWDRRFSTGWFQTKMSLAQLADRWATLPPDIQKELGDFTTWRQQNVAMVNTMLHGLYGAKVTEFEMARGDKQFPNDSDSPTVYLNKMQNILLQARLARARSQLALQAPVGSVKAVYNQTGAPTAFQLVQPNGKYQDLTLGGTMNYLTQLGEAKAKNELNTIQTQNPELLPTDPKSRTEWINNYRSQAISNTLRQYGLTWEDAHRYTNNRRMYDAPTGQT